MFYRIIIIGFLLAILFESKLFCGEDKVFGGYINCTSYLYDYKDGKLDIASKRANEVITYDEKGNKIGYMQLYAEKPIDTYCCKNPARGNEYEESSDFKSGEKFIKNLINTIKKNNMIEEIEFNPNGSILEWSKYKYDEKSREIEKVVYNSDSIIKEIDKTKYVSEDNSSQSEISYYNLDGSIRQWRQIKFDADGNNQVKRNRLYGPNGKIINDYLYNSDGTIFDILNPDPKGNYNPLYMDIDYINR